MSYEAAPPLNEDAAPEASGAAIGRRTFLRGMLATGALAAVGRNVDQLLTQSRWPNTKTIVSIYDNKSVADGNVWIVLPGLGVQDSEGIRRALRPTFQLAGYSGSVRLSDREFNIDDIADGINRAQRKLGFKSVNLFLHSMSGTMLPDLVERFDPAVTLGISAYNCTPWTEQYVADQALVKFIAGLPIEGTYGSKFASQVFDRFGRKQQEVGLTTAQKWGVVFKMTNDDGSPETWLEQIRYLHRRQLPDYGKIPENSRSVFLAPQDLSSDRVVLLQDTLATYREDIPGIKSVDFVRASGHANPRQHPKEYMQALDLIMERPAAVVEGNADGPPYLLRPPLNTSSLLRYQ